MRLREWWFRKRAKRMASRMAEYEWCDKGRATDYPEFLEGSTTRVLYRMIGRGWVTEHNRGRSTHEFALTKKGRQALLFEVSEEVPTPTEESTVDFEDYKAGRWKEGAK